MLVIYIKPNRFLFLMQLDESEPQRQWERQEMLVKKLQNTFPGLDKEVSSCLLMAHQALTS